MPSHQVATEARYNGRCFGEGITTFDRYGNFSFGNKSIQILDGLPPLGFRTIR